MMIVNMKIIRGTEHCYHDNDNLWQNNIPCVNLGVFCLYNRTPEAPPCIYCPGLALILGAIADLEYWSIKVALVKRFRKVERFLKIHPLWCW